MRTLPKEMIRVLAPFFAPLFSKRVWCHVQVLLVGAILAPGKKRTVASALRVVGLQEEEKRFCRYHRVLSRAVWSSKEASRMLLRLIVEAFVPDGPTVGDGHRRDAGASPGEEDRAKGHLARSGPRSSHSHFP